MRLGLATLALLVPGSYGPFVWPTSVDVARDGSVLVVENGTGTVLRFAPHRTVIATGLIKAYAVAVAPSGQVFLSANGHLLTLSHGRATRVRGAGSDVGPIAIARDGAIGYTTSTTAVVLRSGKAHVVARGLGGPHGVAFARDGALLVSDTDHDKVLRVSGGKVTTFAQIDQPRGIDVAPDGTVYVVEATAKRIGVFAADGAPRGLIGPTFGDPYAVAVAGASLWVVDTSVAGTVRRISRATR
jgi:hypothetical protein